MEGDYPHAIKSNCVTNLAEVHEYVDKYLTYHHPGLGLSARERGQFCEPMLSIIAEFGDISQREIAVLIEAWLIAVNTAADATHLPKQKEG